MQAIIFWYNAHYTEIYVVRPQEELGNKLVSNSLQYILFLFWFSDKGFMLTWNYWAKDFWQKNSTTSDKVTKYHTFVASSYKVTRYYKHFWHID